MKDISSRSERTGLLLKVTLGHFLADYTITHFLYILNLKNKHVKNPIQDTNTSTPWFSVIFPFSKLAKSSTLVSDKNFGINIRQIAVPPILPTESEKNIAAKDIS